MCHPGRPSPHGLFGEIRLVFLAEVAHDAGFGMFVIRGTPRKLAVPLERAHVEIDVALDLVGRALLDQRGYHGNNLVDVLRRARCHRRRLDAERLHIIEVFLDVLFRDRLLGRAFFRGACDDLVVDVGEVLDVEDVIAEVLEIAADHVEGHRGPAVPEVAAVVHGRPADVHSHPPLFYGRERLFPVAERVVDHQLVGFRMQ